jgi:hypothetical protein
MNKTLFTHCTAAVGIALASQNHLAVAATTLSVEATSDTFLTNDINQASSDMSSFGAMMISAPAQNLAMGVTQYRTMENLIAYNTASIKGGFDAEYGAENWHVTGVQLKWYSNFDIPGVPANNSQFNVPTPGHFNIGYFSNDNWFNPATAGSAGTANADLNWNSVYGPGGAYNDLFAGQESTGAFYYPGGTYNGAQNCAGEVCAPRFWDLEPIPSMLSDIATGGYLSFHSAAADDDLVYLINQMTKPYAHPQIFITAEAGPAPVPIPAAVWLFGSALAALVGFGRRESL